MNFDTLNFTYHNWNLTPGIIDNPKRTNADRLLPKWRFYPAFSMEFAHRYLESLESAENHIILDPWNGSGTTTTAAACLGLRSIGLDLNPVMRVLARSRMASSISVEIVADALDWLQNGDIAKGEINIAGDPLLKWFSLGAVRNIRGIEIAACGFVRERVKQQRSSKDVEDDATSIIFTALFAVVREALSDFQTSNPTWIKIPQSSGGGKVLFRWSSLQRNFCSALFELVDELQIRNIRTANAIRPILLTASSTNIPLSESSISSVTSSPPYGTRIDYAVATAIECAVLGMSFEKEFIALRRSLIGTTTVTNVISLIPKVWGTSCTAFLEFVQSHPSHASASYYFKSWWGYFDGIFNSLSEINRVLCRGGRCTLVVQDSFYKEMRAPIQEIFSEMAQSLGLTLIEQVDFPTNRTMASIQPHSRTWRKRSLATESVMVFVRR